MPDKTQQQPQKMDKELVDGTQYSVWQLRLMTRIAKGEHITETLTHGGDAKRPKVYLSDTNCRQVLQERELIEWGLVKTGNHKRLRLTQKGNLITECLLRQVLDL